MRRGYFGYRFDLNHDGELSRKERGMEQAFLDALIEAEEEDDLDLYDDDDDDFDLDDDDDFEPDDDDAFDPDDLKFMDEDERREVLEEAGYDYDDYCDDDF